MMCHCSITLDNDSTASSSHNDRNVDTPVIPTNDATSTNPEATASTTDDFNNDIEQAKSKIMKEIKRKLQEVEILQTKLRRLEDL